VVLAFALRHPDAEASFLATAASTHGFVWRFLDVERLPVNPWSQKHVRLVELTAPLPLNDEQE
jgi:hypothetical protein